MTRIAFVTDSTAYLTKQQQQQHGIDVVPLTVVLAGQTYREGIDIGNEQFYSLLNSTKEFPKTSQPAPGAFVEVFERLLKTNDTVLCLLLTADLSGTVNSARQAAQMVGGDIRVVDSRIASYGIAGPLLDGVELARRGGGADEIVRLWEAEVATQHSYFVVDSLELLHRGGRIGGAAAVFGSLLQIKPILTVRDGRIELFEKIRTHKRAMERILALLEESIQTGKDWHVGVVHSNRVGDALSLRDQLAEKYPRLRMDVSELGPVVGSHTGPGVLALVYYECLLGHVQA